MANILDDVSFTITAKDATGTAIGSAKANFTSLKETSANAATGMSDHWESFKKNWVGITASVAAAMVVVNQAMDLIKVGAKAQQVEESFKIVSASANESADQVLAAMKRASAGTISDSDLMQKAVKGFALGLSGDQLSHILEAARVSARVVGEDVETAYEKITDAIATGLPRALKQYGLVTKEEIAVVNAALKAGVKEVDLYRIAMDNAAIQTAKMGEMHDNAAEKLQRWTAGFKDLKEAVAKWTIDTTMGFENIWTLGQKDADKTVNIITEADKKTTADLIASAEAKKKADVDAIEAKTKAIQHQEAAYKILSKVAEDLAKVEEAMGASRIKYAGEQYTTELKKESLVLVDMAAIHANNTVEVMKQYTTMDNLKKATSTYLGVINEVYTARIKGENDLGVMMVKAGVKPAEALKLQIDIATTEKQGLEARQGVWKSYYDRLVQLQATATEQMKTKVNELRVLEDNARKQQETGAQVAVDLQTKLLAAQGKPQTDMQAMKIKNDAIDKQASDASILQGQAKIDALTKLRDMQAALTEATTKQIDVFDWGTGKWVKGTTDVTTAEDQLKKTIMAVQNTTESINLESALLVINKQKEIDVNQKWSSELTTAMATAKTEMDSYQAQIEAISTRIAGMERNVAVQIALDDKVTAGLTQIQALLNDISIPRTASVNLSTGRSLASEGATLNQYLPAIEADKAKKKAEEEKTPYIAPEPNPTIPDFDPSNPGASFASGLNYVPRDNFRARLHEGEAVLPKVAADQWRGGGGQVIHFHLSPTINGAGKDPDQLARELVRPLQNELRRLKALTT